MISRIKHRPFIHGISIGFVTGAVVEDSAFSGSGTPMKTDAARLSSEL
jgi:hypothetical protein